MYNKQAKQLGDNRSSIREAFENGLQRAAVVGAENVFDYSLGNPNIPAPPQINEAIREILDTEPSIKAHGYSPAAGYSEAQTAVAATLTKRFGMEIKPGNLFFTYGASSALIAVMRALTIDKDSEIMAIAPYFPEYKTFTESAGAKFIAVPADVPSFQINMEALEKLVNKNTQAVIVNSPNNPSGVVYTEETLKTLANILNKKAKEFGHPIYIIADEPYRELVYGDVEVPFVPSIYPDTIICYSYAKSLSLAGERIGYVCVPDCAADARDIYMCVVGAARLDAHTCAPSLLQLVIAKCSDILPDLRPYEENRALLYDSLTSYGYECAKPDGAFYLFVKAPNGDARKFMELAKEENLMVVPSDDFGVEGYMRLSYCVSNDMIRRSLPAFKKLIEEM